MRSGISQVDVLTQRDAAAVAAPIHSARIVQFDPREGDVRSSDVYTEDGDGEPLAGFLAQHDVIVNCVLQDPNRPAIFLDDEDLPLAGTRARSSSTSPAMRAWDSAGPGRRSSDDPTFVVGDNVTYYAVDHSPSYLWNSATWEISEALLPHIETVLAGPEGWEQDETIRRAIEIQDGVIRNPSILTFQSRSADYPHHRRELICLQVDPWREGTERWVSSASPEKHMSSDGPGMAGRSIVDPDDAGWQDVAVMEWELTAAEWRDRHPHDELNFILEGELHVESDGTHGRGRSRRHRPRPGGSHGRYWAPVYARMLAVYGPNPDGSESDSFSLRPLTHERTCRVPWRGWQDWRWT